MATLVGTQRDFLNAISELIELDYDAIEAYEAAIKRIETEEYKIKLHEFKDDHQKHVSRLSDILRDQDFKVPEGPSSKQWLTTGKVVIADLFGDKAILAAMLTNEEDTNLAYKRMAERPDCLTEFQEIIQEGLQDEQNHKAWLEETIAALT